MVITLAKTAGFCFGVKRAVEMVENSLGELPQPVRMYGYLVHNEEVVNKFIKKGIQVVNSLEQVRSGTLIITAHGIDLETKAELQKRDLFILDTTCPLVKDAQTRACQLFNEGRQVIIFGDADHQEVKAINDGINQTAIILSSLGELNQFNFDLSKKYGLISQTTQNTQKFKQAKEMLRRKIKDIKIFDTICLATEERQNEARELAQKCEIILVVGSKTSANTTRLYEICLAINPQTYFIQTKNNLQIEWFKGVRSVGITAGASTPDWVIQDVIKELAKSKE